MIDSFHAHIFLVLVDKEGARHCALNQHFVQLSMPIAANILAESSVSATDMKMAEAIK